MGQIYKLFRDDYHNLMKNIYPCIFVIFFCYKRIFTLLARFHISIFFIYEQLLKTSLQSKESVIPTTCPKILNAFAVNQELNP